MGLGASQASAPWDDVAQTYARSFAHLCAGPVGTILTDLGSRAGGTLLDAGCGVGGLARAAAAGGWQVTAVDSSADMVAATRDACRGLPVDVRPGSVLGLPFADGHFDAVVANFVVNHLPDPRGGVRELTRVLKPGGHVALTIWTDQRTAQAGLFSDVLAASRAVVPASRRLPEGKDFGRTVSGLAGIVEEAGLLPVISREIHWDWDVAWADLWAAVAGGLASIGRAYRAQDRETRRRIEVEMRSAVARYEVGGLIRLPSVAAYGLARTPR